ncbi:MAG: cation-efflux pump [Anaerolineae bacterium]|nr:MAG: cation-efflux pump [Anaerolineae bacterium]
MHASDQTYTTVRRVLLGVLLANLAVTALKITLGLLTGALAVVADGFHSLVDSSSNLVGLAAIRLAARPADDRHPYGYRRYETLGSLAIGGLLLAAAWEILKAIIERVQGGAAPHLTPLTVGLVALTFPVNLLIVIAETRLGKRYNSPILLADAEHTKTDLFVTLSVLASLAGVWLGWAWLDVAVALVVIVLILRAAAEILRDAAGWLTDAVMLEPEAVEKIVMQVPGVWYVHRVRSRGTPTAVFVDLHVKVYPGMSTHQAHAVASEVEARLKESFDNVVEVLVHVEPGRPELEKPDDWHSLAYDLRQIADAMALGMHDLHVHLNEEDGYDVELHLELPPDVSLRQAHDVAETFEQRACQRWPRIHAIITHLEPLPAQILTTSEPVIAPTVAEVRSFAAAQVPVAEVRSVQVRPVAGHVSAALQIALPDDFSLDEAHTQAEMLERALLTRFPRLERVTVHVEPQGVLPAAENDG